MGRPVWRPGDGKAAGSCTASLPLGIAGGRLSRGAPLRGEAFIKVEVYEKKNLVKKSENM